MVFSFIFIFVLSFIAISGCYLILKSKLEPSERFYSTIAIMIVFSSVVILNEYKQPPDFSSFLNQNTFDSKESKDALHLVWQLLHSEEIQSFERHFYQPLHNTFHNTLKMPISKDWKGFLSNFIDLDKEKIKTSQCFLKWVDSEQNIGMSFALREFSRGLQSELSDFPIFYIDLQSLHRFFTLDLHFAFQVSSLQIIHQAIENFNKKGKIPLIIVDSIEKSFWEDGKRSKTENFARKNMDFHAFKAREVSKIFERLLEIFRKFEVKLIVVNYHKKLQNIRLPHFAEKVKVGKELRDWEKYLSEVLNEFIGDREKKLTVRSLAKWKEKLDLDFRVISEYYQFSKFFKSPEDFAEKYTNRLAEEVELRLGVCWDYFREYIRKSAKNELGKIAISLVELKNDTFAWDVMGLLEREGILEKEKEAFILRNKSIVNALKL